MLSTKAKRPAVLALEDGSVFRGSAFAGRGEILGEVIFNTGMTGYQEILTDPSYQGQIVAMTYPLIGNTGINTEDMESDGIHLEGLICREYQAIPSNWRSRQTVKDFLEAHGKLGVEGIDTRALTRRLRLAGAMRGICTTETVDTARLLARVRAYPGLVGRDLVRTVSCKHPYLWRRGAPQVLPDGGCPPRAAAFRVVVLDCGVKYTILRLLEQRGCEVVVVPAVFSAAEILDLAPDGVVVSNGPGDPAALPYLVATVRGLVGLVPLFGICLGHQLLGQALGGRTEKLKFGHHGLNQPVRKIATGRIEITSQNHGFVVVPSSLPAGVQRTHVNINDGTSEGLASPAESLFSVQHHPEAAPGPRDVVYLFDDFLSRREGQRRQAP
jgi:carbamoyl-phosphate synthase small subunit